VNIFDGDVETIVFGFSETPLAIELGDQLEALFSKLETAELNTLISREMPVSIGSAGR
jgi:hypothetical protein